MQLLKNKKFKIFTDTWTIKFVDKIDVPEGYNFCFGQTIGDQLLIIIATKDSEGKPLSRDAMEATLYHEVFHAILGAGQYNHECDDEPLVEWLGKSVRSLVKNKILE